MEFENQYLTYEEYVELGGTLEETPFNILEFEAQKNIDRYTFGRIKEIEEQANEVKVCVFELVKVLSNYSKYAEQDKAIASESTDGYSISYSSSNEGISKAKSSEVKSVIQTYLSDLKTDKGVPYLYIGADK